MMFLRVCDNERTKELQRINMTDENRACLAQSQKAKIKAENKAIATERRNQELLSYISKITASTCQAADFSNVLQSTNNRLTCKTEQKNLHLMENFANEKKVLLTTLQEAKSQLNTLKRCKFKYANQLRDLRQNYEIQLMHSSALEAKVKKMEIQLNRYRSEIRRTEHRVVGSSSVNVNVNATTDNNSFEMKIKRRK